VEKTAMTDELADDEFDDDFDNSDSGNVRFERIAPGQYLVAGWLTLNGKRHERKVECRNPAYGFQRLGEEIDELLTQEMARAERRTQHRRDTVLDSREEGEKAPLRKKRKNT
jgi:hypothetical protein